MLATVRMDGGYALPVVCRQGPVLVSAFHPELVAEPRLHDLFLQTRLLANSDS